MVNPKRRMAGKAWVVTALGLFLMFGPVGLGALEGMRGGFALAALGLFLVIIGLTTTFVYLRLARRWDEVLSGDDLLVRWTYPAAMWREFAEKDYRHDRRDKMALFGVIAFFAAFFGLLFFLFDREAGLAVLLVMAGLIVLIFLTARLSARFIYRQNLKGRGEALITPRAVLLSRQLHVWGTLGATLEAVTYRPGKPPVIEFRYSAPAGRAMAEHSVRVPIPPGAEDEAGRVLQFFKNRQGSE